MRECGNFDWIVDASTSNEIVQIWSATNVINPLLRNIDIREIYSIGVVLEAIRLDVYLPSFDKAAFPEIFPEMSAAEKNVELMKTENKYPKTGLAFYRRPNTGGPWVYLSEIVLQNRGRRTQIPVVQPYFTTGDIKLLNRDVSIGIKKVDYGDGTIGNGPIVENRLFDKVQIEADFRIDIDKIEYLRKTKVWTQETQIIGKTPVMIMGANYTRSSWEIQNQSTGNVFFAFDSRYSDLTSGTFIIPPMAVAYSHSATLCETEEIWIKAEKEGSKIAYKEWIYEQ